MIGVSGATGAASRRGEAGCVRVHGLGKWLLIATIAVAGYAAYAPAKSYLALREEATALAKQMLIKGRYDAVTVHSMMATVHKRTGIMLLRPNIDVQWPDPYSARVSVRVTLPIALPWLGVVHKLPVTVLGAAQRARPPT